MIVTNEMTARMLVEMGYKWKKKERKVCLVRKLLKVISLGLA